ncbi:hypothetical protein [Jeotgalibacillus sp. JSM ZJ347]|uniref:hypothetical protein n=1 Tax=Jeotgalibacillus sp. JSM ZJ347 TaxID=3342117 RepID=UPI0035A860CC
MNMNQIIKPVAAMYVKNENQRKQCRSVDMMGRVTSMFEIGQSTFQVLFVLLLGAAADLFSFREAIITAALFMLILSCIFCAVLWKPEKEEAFDE